jgi:hypothetical protein
MVSYWRSFEALEHFARTPDQTHFPAWKRFYKEVGLNDTIGIWHETYKIHAGEYECIYGNMPKFGLANAREATHFNLKEGVQARDRITQQEKQEVKLETV